MSDQNRLLLRDTFHTDRSRGRVVGSSIGLGVTRGGVDSHRSMSVDHGALRITSLTQPGWGTTSLAYGPIEQWCEPQQSDGAQTSQAIAFGAFVLNGHNTAQSEPLGEPLKSRFKRWLKGNESETWQRHLASWVRRGPKRWTAARFLHWIRVAWTTRNHTIELLDENMSIGFLPAASSSDPLAEGNTFVMHATGAANGELWIPDVDGVRRVLPSVQNLPLFLIVVKSAGEAFYFASSIDGARGLPALPCARPLAITVDRCAGSSFAAIQQAVSGQIGFAADTRVFEATVADVTDWLASSSVQTLRENLDALETGERRAWTSTLPAGLIRVRASAEATFDLTWRATGSAGVRWTLSLQATRIDLFRRVAENGPNSQTDLEHIASADRPAHNTPVDLQICDDGEFIGIYLGSALVLERWIVDDREGVATDIDVLLGDGSLFDVTVWARNVDLPDVLRPTGLPEPRVTNAAPFIDDTFQGAHGDLDGRLIAGHDIVWSKTIGTGRIVIGDQGACVDATASAALAGRTAYTVPNTSGGPVEVEIDVIPPGTGRDQGERGRAGVVFWQDVDHALLVSMWIDDHYSGASISSFYRLNGYEDLYDAVWTNVGDRVQWGQPTRLRVAFDGLVFAASLDDELVLYRSIVDVHPSQPALQINRVGLVANWEWGNDTGSVFRRFTGRSAPTLGEIDHSQTSLKTHFEEQESSS